GDLARDVPGLADAAHDHAAVAREDQTDRVEETRIETRAERAHRVRLDREHPARELKRRGRCRFLGSVVHRAEMALVRVTSTPYDRPGKYPSRSLDFSTRTQENKDFRNGWGARNGADIARERGVRRRALPLAAFTAAARLPARGRRRRAVRARV